MLQRLLDYLYNTNEIIMKKVGIIAIGGDNNSIILSEPFFLFLFNYRARVEKRTIQRYYIRGRMTDVYKYKTSSRVEWNGLWIDKKKIKRTNNYAIL